MSNRVTFMRILIMSLVFLAGAVKTGLIGPNRPSFREEFQLSESQFGAGLAGIQIVSSAMVLVLAGRLRRLGAIGSLRLALAIEVAGFALVFFNPSLIAAIVGWSLIAFGTAAAAICNAVSMELWAHNPRRGVALLHGFNGGGKAVGTLIAAACLLLSWRYSFLAGGVVAMCVLVGFLFVGRAHDVLAPAQKRRGHLERHVFRRPFYWFCVSGFALIAGGEAAFATLMPTFFVTARGVPKESAALLLTVHLLGLIAGRFVFAGAKSHISNNTIIGVCLAAGVFVFPAVLAEHWLVRDAALFLTGVMFSATWPTFYVQVARFWTDHKEMLAYGSSLGNMLGIALCIFVSSVIADYDLMLSLFFGPAILWLFGALYYTTKLSREKESRENAEVSQ